MWSLTDITHKPLFKATGKPLIEWHLEELARCGVRDVVINISGRVEQFPATLGNGLRWNLTIRYSDEGPIPLETSGGIRRALPMHGGKPFTVVSADTYSDYDYADLPVEPDGLAHLVMVPNPEFHPRGDFWLDCAQLNEDERGERLTFGNIGVYRPEMFAGEADGRFKLLPIYQRAMRSRQLAGERYHGFWQNIGTPQQLDALKKSSALDQSAKYTHPPIN